MRVSAERVAAIERYHEIGGVLDFAVFEAATPDLADHRDAIRRSIQLRDERHRAWLMERFGPKRTVEPHWINQQELEKLAGERISVETFHGEWFDCRENRVVHRGTWEAKDGTELLNPFLGDLDSREMQGCSQEIPDLWTAGQFAYAFCCPPYSLQARPKEIESLYFSICEHILPVGVEGEFYSWNNPQLLHVSSYFHAGADWWGCFALTIFDPARSRLAAVIGSSTD